MIHRYTIACKTLPNFLKNVLNSAVKIVNFVKKSGTTSRLFKQFCEEMDSDHETLFFIPVLQYYELRTEIKLFLEIVKKDAFVDCVNDETWLQARAYIADITAVQ